MKKFLFIILIIVVALPAIASAEEGAHILVQPNTTTIAQQQQFYVDVSLDAQGKSFNGVQGVVTFSSDTLSFVRAETGSSIISYFIQPPTVTGNTINFSGIILGGFNGLIDPFDQSHKLPGQIMRLVFVSNAPGNATIGTGHVSVTDNDGAGTLETLPDTTTALTISNAVTPSIYTTADTIPPTISALVVHDNNLYDGKYTLLFTATDKQSGIDHVELKEGTGAWTTIQSPYLLHDQSRDSILTIRAYDVVGNVNTITLPSTGSSQPLAAVIILILVVIIILYVIHKKTKHPKPIQ